MRSATKEYWIDFPDWLYLKSQLYQESLLDPNARSSSGAEGIAQFLPQTFADVVRQLGWSGVSANQAGPAISGAAYYMMKLRHQWMRNRTILERHRLAEAAYNSGIGNILKAQIACSGALLWEDIAPCMPQVTGAKAQETITYVTRIAVWRAMLGN
jgi:membrane-bound lytic murein transglycosylase MltF